MRSQPIQVASGAVKGDGTVLRGPMRCLRISPGLYFLVVPPGKRLIGLSAHTANTIQWAFSAVDSENDGACRVVFANNGATANIDVDFRYTVTFAA